MNKIISLRRRSLLVAGASALALPARAAITNNCGAAINASGPLTSFPGLIINGNPSSTITLTSVPSSGSVGVGVSIAFSYTSAAPTGLTAVWNPGAISGAVTGFSASGGTGSATVAPPSTVGTYTLTVTGTGPNSGTSTASNPTVIGAAESVAGTVVNTLGSSTTTIGGAIYASQTPGIAGGPLNIIGINSAGQILVNSGSGFVNVGGSNVIELYYASNHTCYQENSSLNWFGPITTSTTGTQVTNPIPLINSIAATPVSNSPAGYPSTGIEVATLSAAVSGINGSGNYTTFTGTFSIAAGSAAGFSINNSASPPQILTNAVPAAGTYNLNITATQTGTIDGVTVPPFTAPISVTVGTSAVQAPFAIRLGESLGQGGGTEGSISAHMAAVKAQIAIPKVVGAVIINSYQDGFALPSQWGGDVGVWTTGNGLPVDGSMVPQLDGHFTNGTSTDCDYAGVIAGTYDTPLINAFNLWKALAPFPKIYFRINWEFNTNFRGWGVPSSGQVSQWVAAYKHWANVLHTWGNQPGNPKVRMVWSPDTTYTNAESTTFSLPVINFFPQPDGSAVNGRYIDVIGSDNYMNGWGVNGASNLNQGFTTPLASNTNWSLGTFAKMAQTYGCNLGISETGDGPIFDNNASATNGVMSGWANFLGTLQTLSPAVPIEYLTLYDVSDGTADQQSGAGNFPIQCEGWNCAFGNAATQPGGPVIPKVMTIAPI